MIFNNAKLKKLFLGRVVLFAILFIGAISGCDNFSCNSPASQSSSGQVEVESRWARQSPLSANIPATARSVFFSRDLATTADAFQYMDDSLPLAGISTLRQTWKQKAGFDPFEAAKLTKMGVDPSSPTAFFYDRGYWVFAAEISDTEQLDPFFKNFEDTPPGSAGISVELVGDGAARWLKWSGSGEQLGWLGVDKTSLLVAVRVEKSMFGAEDTHPPSAWLSTSKRPRFVASGANQKLLRELTPLGAVVGIVRPAAWMANIKARGHANTLLKRIVSQVGPVGVAASFVSLSREVRLRILTPGNPRAPAMITNLGQADGPLVAPDGLIEPGVLAVARLSVDPRKIYELFVSALPAEQRDEIAEFWTELDKELSIDALRDVLDNLRGHAVLVAYGLDPAGLKPESKSNEQPWYLRTLKLQNTREAVLLPIKEREPLELVLDALTTVSKNKLSRQVAGATIQYAWLDDGELKWAVILGDEHLIFVDSAVAFEHARSYERGGTPMGEELENIGVSRLFSAQKSAGLYLDTASLGGILSETDSGKAPPTGVAWLNALSSVVITIQEQNAASAGVTDVYLRVTPPR